MTDPTGKNKWRVLVSASTARLESIEYTYGSMEAIALAVEAACKAGILMSSIHTITARKE